jgi:hypothetical protein
MSSSSSFFRVSLGTKHPYSPESAHLPGYEPAMLNFGVVLAVFFGATALVGAGTWTRTAGEPREFFFFFFFFRDVDYSRSPRGRGILFLQSQGCDEKELFLLELKWGRFKPLFRE